jgi:membrane-bound inhibitor of C-type lysozyme
MFRKTAMTRQPIAFVAAALALCLGLGLPAAGHAATAADAKKAIKKPVKRAPPKKAVAAAAAVAPLSAADEEQKTAAAAAHLGDYACEFNQIVKVANNNLSPGYIDVTHKDQTWVMKPVLSSTGALRLEDVKERMLMLQIANKSMLMDTKSGQRVVDACQHEKQREFERTLKGGSTEGTLLKP